MKALNFYGLSYSFTPKDNAITDNVIETGYSMPGNKIYFLKDGLVPYADQAKRDELYLIQTANDIETIYADDILFVVPNLTFAYTYNTAKKQRLIQKTPVDALELPFAATGTVAYCAIVMKDQVSGVESVVFTNSIGEWGNQTAPVIIDALTGVIGQTQIFKDLSIVLRDTSSNEV